MDCRVVLGGSIYLNRLFVTQTAALMLGEFVFPLCKLSAALGRFSDLSPVGVKALRSEMLM